MVPLTSFSVSHSFSHLTKSYIYVVKWRYVYWARGTRFYKKLLLKQNKSYWCSSCEIAIAVLLPLKYMGRKCTHKYSCQLLHYPYMANRHKQIKGAAKLYPKSIYFLRLINMSKNSGYMHLLLQSLYIAGQFCKLQSNCVLSMYINPQGNRSRKNNCH